MNCAEASAGLGPWHDGELAPAVAAALGEHVATCATCRAELAALTTLRRDIRAEAPRHAAPASLQARVRAELARHRDAGTASVTTADAAPRDASTDAASHARSAGSALRAAPLHLRQRRRWFLAGAAAGALLAVGVGALTQLVVSQRASDDVTIEAVDSHVRATLGQRLIEVASSDRHTVKPWLSARLPYAAPVPDPVDPAFVLAGARVDSLDRRPVAALVYRYGNHSVDVFVRPIADAGAAPALANVRGFTVARALGAGMEWRAVADVDAGVLAGFVQQLAAAAAAPLPAAR
jgi:anti-sigma factor RsiW